MSTIADLMKEIAAKAAEVDSLFSKSDENDGQMSDDDYNRVKNLNKEIETIEHRVADLKERDGMRSANSDRLKGLREPAAGSGPRFPSGGDTKGNGTATIQRYGKQFVEDEQYRSWLKTAAPGGHFRERMKIDSPAVPIKGLTAKSLITGASDTSAGALVFNDVQAGLNMLGRRPLSIRDVITVGMTDSDTVEYVSVTSETNNAAPVGEATATSGSSGTKPESGFAMAKVTQAVKSIAHWIPATTRSIADAGQVMTLIDNFLEWGLQEELEDQIVIGDGVGENLTGIFNTSGIQTQAWATDILTTLRKARTKVRTVGRATPTAYVLHPNDWETIDLLQDNEGRYFYGGPSILGMPRLWGLPVVECEGVTEGYGLVGNMRTAVLWDREQATIQISNSHQDFFVRNLVAILAELRAAFGVIRPVEIVKADLTA